MFACSREKGVCLCVRRVTESVSLYYGSESQFDSVMQKGPTGTFKS